MSLWSLHKCMTIRMVASWSPIFCRPILKQCSSTNTRFPSISSRTIAISAGITEHQTPQQALPLDVTQKVLSYVYRFTITSLQNSARDYTVYIIYNVSFVTFCSHIINPATRVPQPQPGFLMVQGTVRGHFAFHKETKTQKPKPNYNF